MKKIAYRCPVEWVLLGVFGEGSGLQRDEVYVWSLVMPLYVESTHLVLSHSHRVRAAGTFVPGTQAFAAAIASATDALPSQEEALHRIAAGESSAAPGARALLAGGVAGSVETDPLRAVRNGTAAALGVR
jgi:hypothetical protein